LFHPVFAHFLDDISSNFPVPAKIVKETIHYMQATSAIYESEKNHKCTLQRHLHHIPAISTGMVVKADKTSPDTMDLITLTV
jgi:hypothetical protein